MAWLWIGCDAGALATGDVAAAGRGGGGVPVACQPVAGGVAAAASFSRAERFRVPDAMLLPGA